MRLNVHFKDGEKQTLEIPEWARYVRYNYVTGKITVFGEDPRTLLRNRSLKDDGNTYLVFHRIKLVSGVYGTGIGSAKVVGMLPRHQCRNSWWRLWETQEIEVHD